ncbi:hypothetical protein MHLP_04190 [Candidatus Mycoplasma haematolamae str. Purdue]|uniref:Uncharacterized protein n=1 Tax=Mycoplasma haematolamae (strain Purdue) TaxID=1212765 RepID=I7BKJ9_MYCHA|nr:hypothetical protein [Candidatus Mycoplasma haematolamae]AFO52418.1 hypothetical protein MHLP_04190 [Candidatus Mycoplasma haematolamae str. Purdue]
MRRTLCGPTSAGGALIYKEGKYCSKDPQYAAICFIIGPEEDFKGQGVYFQNGTWQDTSLLDDQAKLDDSSLQADMEKVYKYHPYLKEFLREYIDKHKNCQYTPMTGGFEYSMKCSA